MFAAAAVAVVVAAVAGVSVARLPERQRVSSVISISIFCLFSVFFRLAAATVRTRLELGTDRGRSCRGSVG